MDWTRDERMMALALAEARKAEALGEVPVGAVIARGDEVIATGYNLREREKNALRHAELTAIDRACAKLGGWRLIGCALYVTLEPCPMCAGAILNSRIERVVYGARDPKAGSIESVTALFDLPYNHRPAVLAGVLEPACSKLLTDFFARLRRAKNTRAGGRDDDPAGTPDGDGRREVFAPMQKIDIHVHATATRGPERLAGTSWALPDELRAMYDRIGVEKGLLLPIWAPEYNHDPITSRDAEQLAAARPDTLGWWFCGVDPRMGGNSPDADLSYYLRWFRARGARGVGEITANLPFDDPRVRNLFRHCEACCMPVTIHIGFDGGDYGLIDGPGLPGLERTLAAFPRLTVLGHSQKFWSEISGDLKAEDRGGYPAGKVRPGGRVVELMRRYPNLCGDLSAGSGYNAVSRDPEFGYAFLEEFQDRLFYGTDICAPENVDAPMLRLAAFLDDAAARGRISQPAYEKICRGNALRLLEV